MVSASDSWRANAFRSVDAEEERQPKRRPSLRTIATVLTIFATPAFLGLFGWILAAAVHSP